MSQRRRSRGRAFTQQAGLVVIDQQNRFARSAARRCARAVCGLMSCR